MALSSSEVLIHFGSIPQEHWSNISDETIIPICDCPNVNVGRDDEKKNDEMDGWELCPIAHRARDEYIFSEEVHDHLAEYSHGLRPPCRYGQDCRSLVRLEENIAHRWDDLCHLRIFQHPPRRGKIMNVMDGYNPMSLQKDFRDFSCDKKTERIHPLMNDAYNKLSDHLSFLLIEVIDNGFGLDLVIEKPSEESGMQEKQRQLIEFSQTLKMKLNEMETKEELHGYLREYPIPHRLLNDIKSSSLITIMQIVEKKLKHKRHLNIPDEMGLRDSFHKRLNYGEMLSLILYSGCDCNYDLCKVMRDDSEKKRSWDISLKWKIFEFCLYQGIHKLHDFDNLYSKSVPVYSGIGKVLLNTDLIHQVNSSKYGVQFSSFVSTSRSISVAKEFRGENGGLIFRIQPELQRELLCCDISWISKFPDEQEVLVSFYSGRSWKLSDVSTFQTRDENGQETQVQFFDLVRG